MKVFTLTYNKRASDENIYSVWTDYTELLIVAETEAQARDIADSHNSEALRFKHPWLHPEYTSCEEVDLTTPAVIGSQAGTG